MSIDRAQVAHIAQLARLRVAEDEVALYQTQLSRILELVGEMQAIDTAGVAPLIHPQDLALRMLPDESQAENRRDDYQRLAPATARGFYLTPKVIE